VDMPDKPSLSVTWGDGVVTIPAHEWSAFLLFLQAQGIKLAFHDGTGPDDATEQSKE